MPMVFGQYGNINYGGGVGSAPMPYGGLPPGLNVFEAQKQGWTWNQDANRWEPAGGFPSGGGQNVPFTMPSGASYTAPGGSATSLATGSSVAGPGGQFSAAAQLGQLRDEFRRMRERAGGALNEDLAARGIFSSGVGSRLGSEQRTALDLQEGAAIERIMNDLLGRQQAFDLEKQRLAMSRFGGGSERFGNAGLNQQLLSLFSQMGGGSPYSTYSSKALPPGGIPGGGPGTLLGSGQFPASFPLPGTTTINPIPPSPGQNPFGPFGGSASNPATWWSDLMRLING